MTSQRRPALLYDVCKTSCSTPRPASLYDISMTSCFTLRHLNDVLLYSTCRDELDAAAAQSKSVDKRSVQEIPPLDDDDKRRTPFLGKRSRNPFLGKRRVNPFLGKRRNPFLGKRAPYDMDEVFAEKRRMPFLG